MLLFWLPHCGKLAENFIPKWNSFAMMAPLQPFQFLRSWVVAMEILYVIGMIAVFVLCLALLSTAHRILRASPLSITQTGTSRMYEVEQPVEDPMEESSARLVVPRVEVARFESTLVLNEPLEFDPATETMLAPAMSAAVSASALPAWIEEPMTEDICEQPAQSFWARFPKPTRQTYNYALECALLGVSALVLIQTQRGALRYRSAQPSRERVA